MIMISLTISGFIVICTLVQSIMRQKLANRISFSVPEPVPVYEIREYNVE